ncbi:hypothetical protein BD410DRAFT_809513 [Rickenella mellea]|uniref:Uncharacterized protein n=1 Tax=Rickenella mellea TaxID=50990 RepID=A0A4Y7PJI4_9AGAM|nr:hypothetical protein BD410DRAFT_809513 [Rickenella mellea]
MTTAMKYKDTAGSTQRFGLQRDNRTRWSVCLECEECTIKGFKEAQGNNGNASNPTHQSNVRNNPPTRQNMFAMATTRGCNQETQNDRRRRPGKVWRERPGVLIAPEHPTPESPAHHTLHSSIHYDAHRFTRQRGVQCCEDRSARTAMIILPLVGRWAERRTTSDTTWVTADEAASTYADSEGMVLGTSGWVGAYNERRRRATYFTETEDIDFDLGNMSFYMGDLVQSRQSATLDFPRCVSLPRGYNIRSSASLSPLYNIMSIKPDNAIQDVRGMLIGDRMYLVGLSTSSSVGGLGSVGILAGLGLASPGYPSGSNPYGSKSSFEKAIKSSITTDLWVWVTRQGLPIRIRVKLFSEKYPWVTDPTHGYS